MVLLIDPSKLKNLLNFRAKPAPQTPLLMNNKIWKETDKVLYSYVKM